MNGKTGMIIGGLCGIGASLLTMEKSADQRYENITTLILFSLGGLIAGWTGAKVVQPSDSRRRAAVKGTLAGSITAAIAMFVASFVWFASTSKSSLWIIGTIFAAMYGLVEGAVIGGIVAALAASKS